MAQKHNNEGMCFGTSGRTAPLEIHIPETAQPLSLQLKFTKDEKTVGATIDLKSNKLKTDKANIFNSEIYFPEGFSEDVSYTLTYFEPGKGVQKTEGKISAKDITETGIAIP